MIESVPNYYDKFKCIADRCKHSCCIGWEIDIDDDTMELLEAQTNKEEANIKIDLSKFTKFKKILKETKKEIIENNAIIVVPQQYRQVIFILVSQLFMDIPVICFEEVSLDYKLNILGKI